MSTHKSAEEEAKLVLDIYEYSLANDLNIEDRNDVVKILETLNQSSVSDEHIERLMKALQITAKRIQSDLNRRKKIN